MKGGEVMMALASERALDQRPVFVPPPTGVPANLETYTPDGLLQEAIHMEALMRQLGFSNPDAALGYIDNLLDIAEQMQ